MVRTAAALAFVCLFSAPAFAQVELLPHRATYDLHLKSAKWGSGISSMEGQMIVEFANTCEGYTLNQRFTTEMGTFEGPVMTSNLVIATFEDTKGRSYNFNVRNMVDGKVESETSGRAVTGGGVKGHVKFEVPSAKQSELPEGTIFPTEQTVDVIDGALAGAASVTSRVFDGSGDGEIFDVYTTIGREREAGRVAADIKAIPGAETLSSLRAWPVSMGYFPMTSKAETPQYEVSLTLYANGIATDLTLDYGDFSLTGKLEKIEILNPSGC